MAGLTKDLHRRDKQHNSGYHFLQQENENHSWRKRGSRKCLTLQCKWLLQSCFWEVNATILGQPSSSLSRWFSADKGGTAPHCHADRKEKKYNPGSRKALLGYEKWHIISLRFTWWMIYDKQKYCCNWTNVAFFSLITRITIINDGR